MKNLTIKNGLIVNRESTKLEFKKTFSKNVKSYIKSICAFANNSGGCIVFGVEDKPRKPTGLGDKSKEFRDYDGKDFETELQNILSAKIEFRFREFSQRINNKEVEFGVLEIDEAITKPIICKEPNERERLREGAIYFRYHAKNEEIKAQDLIALIQKEKDKEKELWIKHITKISQIGVSNIGVFSYDGEMYAGDRKIIIDKDMIDKIKFIKEGQFVEKEGAPAFILKGTINNLDTLEIVEKNTDPNITHPYEGINKVAYSIKTLDKKISDKIFVGDKSYCLKFLLQKIKNKEKVEEKQNLFWKNEKGTVKKYSKDFVSLCMSYFKDNSKLQSLFN